MASPGRMASIVRPRTPPADGSSSGDLEHALQFLQTTIGSPTRRNIGIQTPPESSPTKQQEEPVPNDVAERPRKRIRFDTEARVCDEEPAFSTITTPVAKNEPSFQVQPVLKSILKPHQQPQCSISSTLDTAVSIEEPDKAVQAEILETVVKQLDRSEVFARLDAYLTLGNCLRAFKDQPDLAAIRSKLPVLESFVKRDVQQARLASDPRQPKLAAQAVKAVASLFHEHPLMLSCASDHFLDWLASDCIASASSDSGMKEVAKNQLLLFTLKNFSSATLSPPVSRFTQLLECLRTIELRISGHGIRNVRLMIIKTLMEIMSKAMGVKIRLWLPVVIRELSASADETQTRAVEVAQVAALAYGMQRDASRAIKEALEEPVYSIGTNFTTTLFTRLSETMNTMATSKDATQRGRAARIWSSIILFMRSDSVELQQWSRFQEWIEIIKHYFNSLDPSRNLDAWKAWNRFLIAVSPNTCSKTSLVNLLRQPIVGHLNRRSSSQGGAMVYEEAISSYCLLLHYAFRPNASPEQIIFSWKEFVFEIAQKLDLRFNDNYAKFSELLSCLLFRSKLKLWQADIAKEDPTVRFSMEIVPRINSLWVRQHTGSILEVFKPLTIIAMLQKQRGGYKTGINSAWFSLACALQEATAKEIYPTTASKVAASQMLNFLCQDSSSSSTPKAAVQRPKSVVQLAMQLFEVLSPTSLLKPELHSQRDHKMIVKLNLSDESSDCSDLIFFPWLEAYEDSQNTLKAAASNPQEARTEGDIAEIHSDAAGLHLEPMIRETNGNTLLAVSSPLSKTHDEDITMSDGICEENTEHDVLIGGDTDNAEFDRTTFAIDEVAVPVNGTKAPPNTPSSHRLAAAETNEVTPDSSPLAWTQTVDDSAAESPIIPRTSLQQHDNTLVSPFALDGTTYSTLEHDVRSSSPVPSPKANELENISNEEPLDTQEAAERSSFTVDPGSEHGREPLVELDLNLPRSPTTTADRSDIFSDAPTDKEGLPTTSSLIQDTSHAEIQSSPDVRANRASDDAPEAQLDATSQSLALPSELSAEPSTASSSPAPMAHRPTRRRAGKLRKSSGRKTANPDEAAAVLPEPLCDLPEGDCIVISTGPRTMTFREAWKRFQRSPLSKDRSSTQDADPDPVSGRKRKRESATIDVDENSSKRLRLTLHVGKSLEEGKSSSPYSQSSTLGMRTRSRASHNNQTKESHTVADTSPSRDTIVVCRGTRLAEQAEDTGQVSRREQLETPAAAATANAGDMAGRLRSALVNCTTYLFGQASQKE